MIGLRGSVFIALLAAGAAGAQAPEASPRPAGEPAPARAARRVPARVTVSVVLGTFGGGAAPALERGMRDAGYTMPFGGCGGIFGCFPESPSPNSYAHDNPWLLTVAYRLPRRPLAVQLLFGGGSAGITEGRSPDGTLTVDHNGTFVSPQAWVGSRFVRVGAGPALEWHRWQTNGNSTASTQTTRSLGVVGGIAATLPLWRALGLELTAQARAFREARLQETSGPGFARGMPATTASVSHWYVGAGPALRFD